jgi:hypothetical protein
MPQLDKYLIFVETFWFIVFFTLSYFIIYYFLVYLIKGMRLRESFAVQLLISNIISKNEKMLLNLSLLNNIELKLLNEKKIKKMLPIANKIQKKAIRLDFSKFSNSLINRFNLIVIEEGFVQNKKDILNVNKPAMDLILFSSLLTTDIVNKKENDEQL